MNCERESRWAEQRIEELQQRLESEDSLSDKELDEIEKELEELEPVRLPPERPYQGVTQEGALKEYARRYQSGRELWHPQDGHIFNTKEGQIGQDPRVAILRTKSGEVYAVEEGAQKVVYQLPVEKARPLEDHDDASPVADAG